MKVFLSYALSLGGLGLVLVAVAGAHLVNLSYPAARLAMINMLRVSANKAELMCKPQKGTFYEPLGAAIKMAGLAQTSDISIVAMTTKPVYDATCMQVTTHWRALMSRGKKGLVMTIAGLGVAIGVKAHPALHVIVLVISSVAAVWFIHTKIENERSLVRAKAEVLPEIDRAIAEGRYLRG